MYLKLIEKFNIWLVSVVATPEPKIKIFKTVSANTHVCIVNSVPVNNWISIYVQMYIQADIQTVAYVINREHDWVYPRNKHVR